MADHTVVAWNELYENEASWQYFLRKVFRLH